MDLRRLGLRIEQGWRTSGQPGNPRKRRLLLVKLDRHGKPPRLLKSWPRFWGN